MSGRETVLSKIRASLGTPAGDDARMSIVEARMSRPPKGVIPARGQLAAPERVGLFREMAEKANATVDRVKSPDLVPKAVSAYLRDRNLAPSVRMGDDRRLSKMPWAEQKSLEIGRGRSDGDDEVGVSHALGGVAETGTLMLVSGKDNPTTINFLPEHHIVVVNAKDIDGDLESLFGRIRRKFGRGAMPRTVNMVTGPSRSGDIEQKLLLGAHGPRALHIVVVG